MDLVDNELSEPYSIFTYRYAGILHMTPVASAQITDLGMLSISMCSPYHADAPFHILAFLLSTASLLGPSLGLMCRCIPHELRQMTAPCRYFLHSWPRLCWLAFHGQQCFGVVVCKQDAHKGMLRGYIAMLVVKPAYRGLGVGEKDYLHSLSLVPPSLLMASFPDCLKKCNAVHVTE